MKEHEKLYDFKLIELYINCPKYYDFFIDQPKKFKSDIINNYLRKALYTVLMNIQNETINNINHDISTKFKDLTDKQLKLIDQFKRKMITRHSDDNIHTIGLEYPIVIGQTPFNLKYDLIIQDKFKGKFYYYHFNFNKHKLRTESPFNSSQIISAIYQLIENEGIPIDMLDINVFNVNITPHFQRIKVTNKWLLKEFQMLTNIQNGMIKGIVYRNEGKHCLNCAYRNEC